MTTIDELQAALRRAPVMGHLHPLGRLFLPLNTRIVTDAEMVALEMDALEGQEVRPIFIATPNARYSHRFLTCHLPEHPPIAAINAVLPIALPLARTLLTSHTVAGRITADAISHHYQTVILLLVDGLSYADVRHWTEKVEPCFIDGVSITFARTENEKIRTDVGFPAIISEPSIARRLLNCGLRHSLGFSYWQRDNIVTNTLFRGMALRRVSGIVETVDLLAERTSLDGLYIQIVREGTDGLAHSRREVTSGEVATTVAAIRHDLHTLATLLAERKLRGAVYLVADHGILWKREHNLIDQFQPDSRPRYTSSSPAPSENSTQIGAFHLYNYPYLGKKIRANDSGVHGGLSYWESFVPFVRVEVN